MHCHFCRVSLVVTLAALVATAAPSGPVLAQLIPAGPELRVNGTTAGSQLGPTVVTAPDGRFIVAWQSLGQDGAGYGVYARRFAADGTAQGEELRVNTTTAGSQLAPVVAVAPDGRFVIAWQSFGQDGSGYGVYARRFAADGTAQGEELRVNTTTAGSQLAPAVAMAADGRFVVAWQSLSQDGDGYEVFARRFAANGTAQATDFRVNATVAGSHLVPAIAMAPDGRFVIAWQSLGQDAGGSEVHARRFEADGTAQGSELRINTTTAGSQLTPAVAMAADGRFVVAWELMISRDQSDRKDEIGFFDIFAQRFAADGTMQGPELRVNTTTASDQLAPAVAMAADGRLLVAWQSLNQDASGLDIFAQWFLAPNELTVVKAGSGEGTVTSNPAGISCGQDCAQNYPSGTEVTLTATPAIGSSFVGWSGACSGAGPCRVSLDGVKSVTATFQRALVGVHVTGGPVLTATLTARPGCGAIDHLELGDSGVSFNNAQVSIVSPAGGPEGQTTGFSYRPPPGTNSVTLSIQRVVQSEGATVNPIRFFDGCGEWRTFVGGGPDAFR